MSEIKEDELLNALSSFEPSSEGERMDWVLRLLAKIANRAGEPFKWPLTVMSNGLIVSGNLISGSEYSKRMADENPDLKPVFEHLGEDYVHTTANGEDEPDPVFLHMSDTRIFFPGTPALPGNGGVLWRGRISGVTGFWLGALSENPV